ncbi:MAG: hypothetical protein K6E71_03745 [Lachnospiraceae bacterium]|nr:hypothetical protein [Lachnospiraceae bacterium]
MKQRLRWIIGIVVLTLLVSGILFFWRYRMTRAVSVKSSGISLIKEIPGVLSEDEKAAVCRELRDFWIEDESVAGYSFVGGFPQYYLSEASYLVSLAKVIPGFDLSELRDRLSFVQDMSPEGMGGYDLLFFVNVLSSLGLEVDYDRANKRLDAFFDEKSFLFAFREDDTDADKLIITRDIREVFGENLANRFKERVATGLRKMYATYDFDEELRDSERAYSTGETLLQCMKLYGLEDMIDWGNLSLWVEEKISRYNKREADQLIPVGSLNEFGTLIDSVRPGYGKDRVRAYYESINNETFIRVDGLTAQWMAIAFRDIRMDNEKANEALRHCLNQTLCDGRIISADTQLDKESTVYGLLLNSKVGMGFNNTKIQAYANQLFKEAEAISDTEKRAELASNLYFGLCIWILSGAPNERLEKDFWQKNIDRLVDSVSFSDSCLNSDIQIARRVTEIVSELQSIGVRVQLNGSQYRKIKKGITKALRDDEVCMSGAFVDICRIDQLLSIRLVEEKETEEILHERMLNGGVCGFPNIPTIDATYDFFIVLDDKGKFEFQIVFQEFVQRLKTEGVFVYSDGAYSDLKSTAMGYFLQNYRLSGG